MMTDNLGLFLALRAQWNKSAWGPVTAVTTAGAAGFSMLGWKDAVSGLRCVFRYNLFR